MIKVESNNWGGDIVFQPHIECDVDMETYNSLPGKCIYLAIESKDENEKFYAELTKENAKILASALLHYAESI